jgi:hypothetical protein
MTEYEITFDAISLARCERLESRQNTTRNRLHSFLGAEINLSLSRAIRFNHHPA